MKKFILPIFALMSLYGCSGDIPRNYAAEYAYERIDALKEDAKILSLFISKNSEELAINKSKEMVLEMLKDPESARFKSISIVNYKNGKLICGLVNSKNSYGGYVGFTKFLATQKYAILNKSHDPNNEIENANLNLINLGCP